LWGKNPTNFIKNSGKKDPKAHKAVKKSRYRTIGGKKVQPKKRGKLQRTPSRNRQKKYKEKTIQ